MLILPSFCVIAALKITDAAVVVLFGPTHKVAAGRMRPAVVAVHQTPLNNRRCGIKVFLLKGVVACQQGGDVGLIYFVEVKLIRHFKVGR